jgi:hypothetical protein
MKIQFISYKDSHVVAIYYRHIDTVFYNTNFDMCGAGLIYLRN